MNLLSCGFENFTGSQQEIALAVNGKIPTWLSGSYVKMGMGAYQVGTTSMQHWFDGYALSCKFTFKKGQVLHQSQFVDSDHYLTSTRANKIIYSEFATPSNLSFFSRLANIKNNNSVVTYYFLLGLAPTPPLNSYYFNGFKQSGRVSFFLNS